EVFRTSRADLVTYAARRGADDPELLADRALTDCYGALSRLRSRHPKVLLAYAYRALDSHLAKERSRPRPEIRDDLEDLAPSDSFEEQLLAAANLDDLLRQLSPAQAEALRLQLVDDLSSDEAGRRLGKSPVAVRQLQHQGIRRLRRLLYGVAIVLIAIAGVVIGLLQRQAPDPSPVDRPTTTIAPPETVPTTVPTTGPSLDAMPGPGRGGVGAAPDPGPVSRPGSASTTSTTVGVDPAADPRAILDPAAPPLPASDHATEPGPVSAAADVFGLVNAGSGRCLDQPWSSDNGAQLIQWRCAGHTATNQLFAVGSGTGGFTLVLQHSGKCLDVPDGRVIQWDCHGEPHQTFNWDGDQLRVEASGWCLTVLDARNEDEAELVARPCTNDPSQRFRQERYGR
ncbi:MAG: RICIN domain-containing protein, partial [Actinomycetota bacterium]